MNGAGFLAVGVGAMLGAWARWLLGLWLNAAHPWLPLGTLAANLAGGLLVGVAVAAFSDHPLIDAQWRLFLVTGFLGALTTFSTFSAEGVALLMAGRIGAALTHAALHLAGSLVATWVGIVAWRSLAA
ncbi:MAG: fluoride efflux transporter CrcB [Delftia acidovorans]|nr:fluoride efflux transporter CrcB [Delftia acidovorans]